MNNFSALVKGYQKFHTHYYGSDKTLFENLVKEGQRPKFMFIACCDSRVDPAIITDCSPGDLFVVRNVANLVPPCDSDLKHHATSAALEFAVCNLQVKHIIILGHSDCGGIQALMKNEITDHNTSFITSWMNIAQPARQKVLTEFASESFEQQTKRCEKMSLMISLKNLYTFPWVKEGLKNQQLSTHAWHFDLPSGQIVAFNPENQQFEPL